MEPVRREASTEDFRRHLRPLLNEVEHDGAHLTVKRYSTAAAVLVPVAWYEAAIEALKRRAAA